MTGYEAQRELRAPISRGVARRADMMRMMSTDPPWSSSCKRVRHHKDHEAVDSSNGLPPLFTTLIAILHGDMRRILKHQLGFLEAHTVMLALI